MEDLTLTLSNQNDSVEPLYRKKDGKPPNSNIKEEPTITNGVINDKPNIQQTSKCLSTNLEDRQKSIGINLNDGYLKKAPLVGWHNGSPTIIPSSPTWTPENSAKIPLNCLDRESLSSKSFGMYHDSGNTEDLSSLADERLWGSTTAASSINRSVESITPDKDTFLTASPDLRSKDITLDEDLENKTDLLSPVTDITEDAQLTSTFGDTYPTSPNLTVGQSPTDVISVQNGKQVEEDNKIQSGKDPVLQPTITPNVGYREEDPVVNETGGESDGSSDFYLHEDSKSTSSYGGKKPKIPDGGWGWMVVLSSLVISMIADGVSFSFGLLYIEFLKEFQASKSKTAWIGSLFMAVPLLSGPVMSALVDRYGCRKMTILGGLISGLGFVLSVFGRSIEVMYLTFGVIAGLGLGLCYVTAVVSIAYWFDKKRTLAVGLGACGTGIGTFVYAPMTTFFIDEYGWRGTCLLLAGTFFNMIVCGAIMRDPEWWVLEQKKQSMQSPKKSLARSEANRSPSYRMDDLPDPEQLRKLLKSGQTPEYLLQSLTTSTEERGNVAFRSAVNIPTFVNRSEKVPWEVLESLSANSPLYKIILESYPGIPLCRSLSDKKLCQSTGEIVVNNKSSGGVTMSMRFKQATDEVHPQKPPAEETSQTQEAPKKTKFLSRKSSKREMGEIVNPLIYDDPNHIIPENEKVTSVSKSCIPVATCGVVRTDSLPWLRRQFSTNTHYFKDIRVHRNSVMYRGAALNLHKYRLRASSCPNIYRNSMTTLAKENEEKWYAELVDLLKGMMDFSMFLEWHFLLLSLSTILLFTWFIVPYFYLAEHLTRNGYSEEDGAQLLSIIGITNTIGMVGLGWAGDQPWMNVSKTYTWCLVACGIATILMSVFTHYYTFLAVSAALFGLFFASNFSFTPVILVELIPLERFTTAYGLSLLCQGIGNLLGPPLAGYIFDVTGSWDLSFILAGAWIIVSGFLIGLIPYTKNRKIWGVGPVEMERDRDSIA